MTLWVRYLYFLPFTNKETNKMDLGYKRKKHHLLDFFILNQFPTFHVDSIFQRTCTFAITKQSQ